jgi:dolichyl-phosphate-mannose--protein O-mannosyl transferase
MPWSKKLSIPFSWSKLVIATVFVICVYLRFWGLSRFNTLVFDEVYYAKFANDYLTNTKFFNAHPPLSQYLIAIAIWIGSHIPIGQDTVNSLTGSLRSTWSYRWLNALTGSFIPLVVAGIAYQLTHRGSYAAIAAIFAAADGLFLVESRYALNNVYLVIFGLLGQWFLLLALDRYGKQRSFWLILAGIGFGASAAIKWNGLWFLLGAYLTWLVAWVIQWVESREQGERGRGGKGEKGRITSYQLPTTSYQLQSTGKNLTQLNLLSIVFYLGIIPVFVYSISWIPHLQLNPTPGFLEIQKQILEYHQRIGSSPEVHPYCSAWYTWLLMVRPVAYFYKTAHSITEPIPIVGPPLPATDVKVIYDVHAMGNPLLWWFSTAAIVLLLWMLVKSVVQRQEVISNRQEAEKLRGQERQLPITSPLPANTWIAVYLIINWLANLLPWMRVTRCTFLYHYMGASVFAGLALAWIVDYWLHSYRRNLQVLGITAIFLVLLAFVFWMPMYLGLPLSPESYKLRMWFPSWI